MALSDDLSMIFFGTDFAPKDAAKMHRYKDVVCYCGNFLQKVQIFWVVRNSKQRGGGMSLNF